MVYRDGETLLCPRCGDTLLVGPLASVCPRDCGEWVDAAAVRELDLRTLGEPSVRRPRRDHGTEVVASLLRPGTCARCREGMSARTFERTEVDVCATHGVWVDTRYRSAFAVLVAEVALSRRT